MKKLVLSIAVLLVANLAISQTTKVLFIGNSYTGANNLPLMTLEVSASTGDTLIIDSHTPGGARFLQHASSAAAMTKIASNNWNYVVLQAQSQEPSWPISQVTTEVFPYAKSLCDTIRAFNSCAMPVFYMTWGRKNGDSFNCPNWPPVCTYQGMDSLLNERYQTMAEDNNALVSPVGAVWKYVRANYPNIELYTADESHPSVAGTYAAACTFYTIFLRKDPTQINFEPAMDPIDAQNIRASAKAVAFDSLLHWNVGEYDPNAEFTMSTTAGNPMVTFANQSTQAINYLWNFGDGDTSTLANPTHSYLPGNYTVQLTATNCNQMDTTSSPLHIVVSGVESAYKNELKLYPNPATNVINIELEGNSFDENKKLELFDVTGKMVQKYSISSTSQTIYVSHLPRGMYTFKLGKNTGNLVLQ